MLSPTASNAPARGDTHPAAWIVPVGGETLAVRGARDARTHSDARGLHPQGPYLPSEVRSRRRAAHLSCARRAVMTAGVRPDSRDRPTPGTAPALAA